MRIGLLTAGASRRAAGVWFGVARLGKALAESGLNVEIFGLADPWTATDCAGWDGPPLRLHHVLGSGAFGYAPRLGRALDGRCPSMLMRMVFGCTPPSQAFAGADAPAGRT